MKKIYSQIAVALIALTTTFATSNAQNPVNAGPDIYLPCNTNCTNIAATLASMPSVATNTYAVSTIPYAGNYGPYTAGTNYSALGDDGFGPQLPLPFTFCFYGQNFNNIVLGSNGIVTFTAAYANAYCPWQVGNAIPSGNYATYSIMGDYTDLHPLNNPDKIKTLTVGAAPNRKFVINYNGIGQYGNTGTLASFQIVLYETTNVVEVYIQVAPNASSTMGLEAIVGIQQDATTALAAPGRNSVNWSVLNTVNSPSEAWRWTPTGGTSGGAPLSVSLTNINGLLVQNGIPVPNGPNYSANFTNICPTTDTTDYIVQAVYVTCAGNTTFKDTVRIIKTVTPPPTVTTPVVVCQFSPGQPLQATGQNLLWYTVPVGGVGSSVTPIVNTAVAGPVTYWVSQTIAGCESIRVPINITVKPTPTIVAGSNSPVCAGTTINLTGTPSPNPLPPGTTFQWLGPNGFNSTLQNPNINFAQPVNAGTYTLVATANGCASTQSTTIVQVQPNPFIALASAQSASTCAGTGQITLSGLTANTNYTVNYSLNGTAQPPVVVMSSVAGQVIITGLGPGSYTNITVTIGSCTSNTMAGPYIINSPSGITVTTTSVNPTTCSGTNGSITINGLTAGTNYTFHYTLNGTPVTLGPSAPGTSYTFSGLSAGTYTNIFVTIVSNNCPSNTIASIVLTDPPTPVITVTFTNPTTCVSNNGTITINGLTAGSSYQLNYTLNGAPVAGGTITPTTTSHTITGLGGGNYTGISVTINGCTSNPESAVLVTPAAPPTPVVAGNGPLCAGETLNLTTTATGVTYAWSGPGGWTSTLQNPSRTNIQVNQAGAYSLVVVANNCSSAAGVYNLVVNPSPVTPIAGPDDTVCTGDVINLTANTPTPGVTWSWTSTTPFTSALQNPTIAGATAANSGAYYVRASAAGCNSLYDTVNILVVTPASIQYTSTNPTTCGNTNGSITLNVLTPGYAYTVNYTKNGTPQTATLTANNNGEVIITGLSAGTYTNISVTFSGCQSNIVGPVVITDPTLPPTPTANNNGPLCEGDALNLTATNVAGATYSWTGPGFGSPNTNQNPTIGTTTLADAGAYSVVAIVNGCTSLPGVTNVVINPVPATPNLTGTTTSVCEGDVINLVSNPIAGVSYDWNGPNGYNATVQSPTIPNAQTNMSGTYTLVVDNGTCDATSSVAVTVHPIPGAPVTADIEVCQYEVVVLTAQGQNLLWYPTATGGSGVSTMTANTQTPGGPTYYYVSQTVNGCESARRPLGVTVKPQPVLPTAQQNYTYCQYEVATPLTATGNNLKWYNVATGGTPLGGAPTPNTDVPGTFKYYVTQTDSACESNRTEIEVIVHPKPDLPVVEQITICQDEANPSLNAQGQNLLWYTDATGGTGSATVPMPTTAVVGVTDYYVSQTINGCEGDRALIRVTVNPKVEADFSTDKDTVCDSYPLLITFTGIAPAGATYDWSFDGASEVTGTEAGPYTVIWDTDGTKTITLTVTNLNCTSTYTKTVQVLPTPDPVFNIQPDACINEELRLQAGWGQMDLPGYNWNFDGAQVLEGTGPGPYTLKWNTAGQKVISMSLTNIPCPSIPYYDTINIHDPVAKIMSKSTGDICTSDSVLFTAQPGLDYRYEWSPVAFFGESSNSLSMWGVVRKAGYVWLNVTDRWGCEATDSVLLQPKSCCEVFMPNTFTPNGDGKNDVFRMVTEGNHEISVFIIMDRWGKRVFESINQYEPWDGSFNGEPQDMGTYQYYLRFRCADSREIVEMKGDVILLR